MSKEEALRLLRLGTATERLEAARRLAVDVGPEDLQRLENARQREPDSFVAAALDHAIQSAMQSLPEKPVAAEPSDGDLARDDHYARGFEEATLMVVHELGT